MTKNAIDVLVQPALAEMTAEARAWARDLMEKVSTELAKRQK